MWNRCYPSVRFPQQRIISQGAPVNFLQHPGVRGHTVWEPGTEDCVRDYLRKQPEGSRVLSQRMGEGDLHTLVQGLPQCYYSAIHREFSRSCPSSCLSTLPCGYLHDINNARNDGGLLGVLGSSSRSATWEVQRLDHNFCLPKSLPGLSMYESMNLPSGFLLRSQSF